MDNDLLVLALNIAKIDRPLEPAVVTLDRAVKIAEAIDEYVNRRKVLVPLGKHDEVYCWDEQKKTLMPLDTSDSKQTQ